MEKLDSGVDFAPMESIGSVVYRNLQARRFGGVDRYYIPFVTPTVTPEFTDRQLREIAYEANRSVHAVPQLLTRRADDFIWAAKTLSEMGYDEVNFNLGCPAGTVVAKGKGSGFLRDRVELERFLDHVFSADLPIAISVKTRIGWAAESEFEALCDIFNHFPISKLIIHPRLKTDQYKGYARRHVFDEALKALTVPVEYNGDIVTVRDVTDFRAAHPTIPRVMIGRALVADPALARKVRGGDPCSRKELEDFSEELFECYTEHWKNRKNSLMRMKEYWFYFANLFENAEKPVKAVFKSKNEAQYKDAVKRIFDCPMRTEAAFGWFKAP